MPQKITSSDYHINSNLYTTSSFEALTLYKYNVSLLDLKIGETMLIGKAASLASHLRGIQVIEDYDNEYRCL